MVNTTEFIDRIKKVMNAHDLSASLFADKIGVQRSSISHLLSGRNKPSLDFVLKVTQVFQDVDIYWLLNGKGIFPKAPASKYPSTTPLQREQEGSEQSNTSPKKIQRIVVFYSDGTFEEYIK